MLYLPNPFKRCTKCGEWKLATTKFFHRQKNRGDGLICHCKDCACGRVKKDYWENHEKRLEEQRQGYIKHRDARLAYFHSERRLERERERYQENPEYHIEKTKRSYRVHRSRRLAYAHQYRQKAHDQRSLYMRNWRAANRKHRMAYKQQYEQRNYARTQTLRQAARRNRRARIRGNGGTFTATEWEALKARYAYTCLCCGRSEPAIQLEADHVIPIAKGGLNTIDNIQPLCGPCNRHKSAKIIDYRR